MTRNKPENMMAKYAEDIVMTSLYYPYEVCYFGLPMKLRWVSQRTLNPTYDLLFDLGQVTGLGVDPGVVHHEIQDDRNENGHIDIEVQYEK